MTMNRDMHWSFRQSLRHRICSVTQRRVESDCSRRLGSENAVEPQIYQADVPTLCFFTWANSTT